MTVAWLTGWMVPVADSVSVTDAAVAVAVR